MPPSKQDFKSSPSQYSAPPMTTNASFVSNNSSVGIASPKRDSRSGLPSQRPEARKRTSYSVAEAYTDVNGQNDFDDMLVGRQARERSSIGAYNDSSKRSSRIYEDEFSFADSGRIKERVHKESPIVAELKTNVIIKDEFTLVTDLSYHLAQRYARQDSAIMIKVDHSACLAMGGTFDPCYILTLTSVPSEMSPTTNKRNAMLIQSFLADILSVSSDRGIVKFQPILECNFATNGTTMQGQIEKLEKHQTAHGPGSVSRAVQNSSRNSTMSSKTPTSTLKPDTSVKTPNGGARTPNGLSPLDTKGRSNSTTPSQTPLPGSALPHVFELSGTDTERPATSQGSYAAENGLRMNGISKEELDGSRQSGERPKTVAGQSPHRSMQEEIKNEPMPKPHRQSSYQSQTKRSSMIRDEPKKANMPVPPRPKSEHKPFTASVPRAALKPLPPLSHQQPKNTYLDGVTTTSSSAPRPLEKVDPKIDARAAEKNRQVDIKDTAANTARRRSTVTATPKMPTAPPIPEDKRRPDMRVGKRKSFLSAFRRSTAGS